MLSKGVIISLSAIIMHWGEVGIPYSGFPMESLAMAMESLEISMLLSGMSIQVLEVPMGFSAISTRLLEMPMEFMAIVIWSTAIRMWFILDLFYLFIIHNLYHLFFNICFLSIFPLE